MLNTTSITKTVIKRSIDKAKGNKNSAWRFNFLAASSDLQKLKMQAIK